MTVRCLYFSPCGSTKAVAYAAAEALDPDFIAVNLTDRDARLPAFAPGDVAVVAAPVYGGRIPKPMADKLAQLRGCGACAVTFVTYGNRAYEDALLETNDLLIAAGFTVAGSGAFVTRHVFVPELAKGRPSQDDLSEAAKLARTAARKFADGVRANVEVPGNRPYKDGMKTVFAPSVAPEDCDGCGLCVRACPMGAIDPKDTSKVDLSLCIDCMRCVEGCPNQLRALPAAALEAIRARLSPLIGVVRANETFV